MINKKILLICVMLILLVGIVGGEDGGYGLCGIDADCGAGEICDRGLCQKVNDACPWNELNPAVCVDIFIKYQEYKEFDIEIDSELSTKNECCNDLPDCRGMGEEFCYETYSEHVEDMEAGSAPIYMNYLFDRCCKMDTCVQLGGDECVDIYLKEAEAKDSGANMPEVFLKLIRCCDSLPCGALGNFCKESSGKYVELLNSDDVPSKMVKMFDCCGGTSCIQGADKDGDGFLDCDNPESMCDKWCIDEDQDGWCSKGSTRRLSEEFYKSLSDAEKKELESYGWKKDDTLCDTIYQDITEKSIQGYFADIPAAPAYDCMRRALEPQNLLGKNDEAVMKELAACFPDGKIPDGLVKRDKEVYVCPACDSFEGQLLLGFDDAETRTCRIFEDAYTCYEGAGYLDIPIGDNIKVCDQMNPYFPEVEYPYVCAQCNEAFAGIATPQCTDGIDNDNDRLKDNQDPDCHTDNKAENSDSYDPAIRSESDNSERDDKYGLYISCKQFETDSCDSRNLFDFDNSICYTVEQSPAELNADKDTIIDLRAFCGAALRTVTSVQKCAIEPAVSIPCFKIDSACKREKISGWFLASKSEFARIMGAANAGGDSRKADYSTILDFDCDDKNKDVHPLIKEEGDLCFNDIDDDCDLRSDTFDAGCGFTDADGDGFFVGENVAEDETDCNDRRRAINPGMRELCNGYDDNCDGDLMPKENEDIDGDGVMDCKDKCLDEGRLPKGAVVNAKGCSLSSGEEDDGKGWKVTAVSFDFSKLDTDKGRQSSSGLINFVTGDAIIDITGNPTSESYDSELGDSSYIIIDSTAPEGDHSFRAEKNHQKGALQEVELDKDTVYSVSFYSKMGSGAMKFIIDDGSNTEYVDIIDKSWRRTEATFKTPSGSGKVTVTFGWYADNPGSGSIFYLDGVQLEEAEHPTNFYNFKYEYGCCPDTFCWTGGTCIQDEWYETYVLFPPIAARFGEDGYRCVDGEWDFSKIKFDPRYRAKGYCTSKTQCFGDPVPSASFAFTDEDLLEIEQMFAGVDLQNPDPLELIALRDFMNNMGATADEWCRANNTYDYFVKYDESFYCYEGEWSTRTKAIALQLLELVDNDEYTLFCDKFSNALGESIGAKEFAGEDVKMFRGFGFEDSDQGNVIQDFFLEDEAHSFFNEFCVLRTDDKILVGTSLNNVTFTEKIEFGGGKFYSILELIKGAHKSENKDYCNDVVDLTDGDFHPCNQDKSEIWYNPELESFIFTMIRNSAGERHEIDIPVPATNLFAKAFEVVKSILDRILTVLGIARGDISQMDAVEFVRNAGDFDKLYISNFISPADSGKRITIQGLRETTYDEPSERFKTIMTVEYSNYYADVCGMLAENDHISRMLSIEGSSPIGFASRCSVLILDDDSWQYNFYVEKDQDRADPESKDIIFSDMRSDDYFGDEFWNDLTAKIRTRTVGVPDKESRSDPEIADFEDSVMVNQRVNFSVEELSDLDGIKAVMWDFGDDNSQTLYVYGASTDLESLSATHIYQTPSPSSGYEVKLYVLYDDYNIIVDSIDDVMVYSEVSIQLDFIGDEPLGTHTGVGFQVDFDDPRGDYEGTYGYIWCFGDDECIDPAVEYTGMDDTTLEVAYKYAASDIDASNGIFDVTVLVDMGLEKRVKKTLKVEIQYYDDTDDDAWAYPSSWGDVTFPAFNPPELSI